MSSIGSYQNDENLGQVVWEFLPGILKFLSFIGILAILIVGGQAFLQATDTLEGYSFEPDLVRSNTPVFGKEDAEITVVLVSDYQCVACASYDPGFREVEEEFLDRVRFVHKHQPIESIHPYAESAAEAVQAAHNQGLFLEFSDLVYSNQDLFNQEGREALEIWANQIEGLDVDQWNIDRNSAEIQRQVQYSERDIEEITLPDTQNSEGSKPSGEGVPTPTTIIMRGEEVLDWWSGALPPEDIRVNLEAQLN